MEMVRGDTNQGKREKSFLDSISHLPSIFFLHNYPISAFEAIKFFKI